MATINRGEQIYEGKAKILYLTNNPKLLIQYFKDDATAFNAAKKGTINGKGVINNKISSTIFKFLEGRGIKTHFVDLLSDREMLVKHVKIFPLEVVIRNITAGSVCKRLGLDEGVVLEKPLTEFFYKSDSLNDPLVNRDHIIAFDWATPEEFQYMWKEALRVNEALKEFWKEKGVKLVDFKLEFGRDLEGNLVLADEVSPDTCRLWDAKTNQKLDKDRFRFDLGAVEESYKNLMERVAQ
ncbi:MAG: phosphoribosylaminoimidazolesuccinocarboxamide synthase [Deltaproteobacteria bacterium RIFCSPHIGHO2_12_FULL_43_9]|nr:MAG: phosphoribosylaminoimidazolesuccinocarboxamide synthase [Deltaproteobacteria bacterium RIFCSPHIGHO2_12_FULL_43_9]